MRAITDTMIASNGNRFTDARYALCDLKTGWDCLNYLRDYYTGLGADFPMEWRGYNESNYAQRWLNNEEQCRKDLSDFLKSFGREIENHAFMKPADMLLFESPLWSVFPAIYQGSGRITIVSKAGVRIFPLGRLREHLIQVRRVIE